jgi:hypothetical protein
MNRVVVAVLVAGTVATVSARAETLDQPCRGLDGTSVRSALDACAKDTGINEGASCAGTALGLVDVPGLPGQSVREGGSNYWTRQDMMTLIKQKAREGKGDAAVDAAICCQVQNPEVRACLQRSRPAVAIWLRM